MTINAQTGISDVMLGDGVNLVFPFDFKVGGSDELVVYVDGVSVSAADYSVDLSDDWTGDVTFDTAPADGAEVVIVSDPDFVQSSVHQRPGPFFPDIVEDDLDRATLRDIYLKREIGRALKLGLFTKLVDYANKYPMFDADGNLTFSNGIGADAGLREDLADRLLGGSLVAYANIFAPPAMATTVQIRLSNELSITDFGAIGDGTTHTVAEWVPSKYANLAAIQADYPDVTDLTDSIDFAAVNKAIRVANAQGKGVWVPAGAYRGWIYARYSNLSIRGAGSACTFWKLPDGALRTVPDNNAGGGPFTTGVPCVVDFNNIGNGNDAPVLSKGHISGMTLDGNVAGTDVPDVDLHGWGMSFTKYSEVTYHDIHVINTHCGGVGTFINSNRHDGFAFVDNCGHSFVGGGTRPGFDVNSSRYSNWRFISKNCAYGARLLDNCYGNKMDGVIENATTTGFVYGNQTVNPGSWANDINLTITGGCVDYGVVVGAKCDLSTLNILVDSITGTGIYTVDQADPTHTSKASTYNIQTRRCGGQSCLIFSNNDHWNIVSIEDGRNGAQGSVFAVDVYGDRNHLDVQLIDTAVWQVRGLAFRAASNENKLLAYSYTNTADPFLEQGAGNVIPEYLESGFTAPSLINSFTSDGLGGSYYTAGYKRTTSGKTVRLRGSLQSGAAGAVAFNLPAGFRPTKNIVFSVPTDGGVARVQVGSGGDVQVLGGSNHWLLDGIEFETRF